MHGFSRPGNVFFCGSADGSGFVGDLEDEGPTHGIPAAPDDDDGVATYHRQTNSPAVASPSTSIVCPAAKSNCRDPPSS
eukprot:scaffold18974_cov20-Prasinocladus_malaysianus.AAC.1